MVTKRTSIILLLAIIISTGNLAWAQSSQAPLSKTLANREMATMNTGFLSSVEVNSAAFHKAYNRESRVNNTYHPVQPVTNPAGILKMMHEVANWQLAHPLDHNKLNWHYGAFYSGLWAFYELTGEQKYIESIKKVGKSNHWQLMNPIYHADHLTVGQSYLDLYIQNHNGKILENMKWAAGMYLDRDAEADVRFEGNPYRLEWWTWCDALFMAPAFFAKMYKATGNEDYLDYMNKHWWLTSHYLYDSNEHLFYRDDRFFDSRTKNGKKVFWSRGNGWVMGGLVHVLQIMPDDYIYRSQYVEQFKEMAQEILSIQSKDGLWRPSLLDPEEYNVGESSGSGFFCYALAWGVNNGILKGDKFKKAALDAWEGLVGNVNTDGRLGYVQPVGGSPESVKKDQYEVYGAGAFLLAGTQIYQLIK